MVRSSHAPASRLIASLTRETPPNADQYEAICEFFGWPDSRRDLAGSLMARARA